MQCGSCAGVIELDGLLENGFPKATRIVRSIQHEDTSYRLYVGPCPCGGRSIYRLTRTCGAAVSVYEITQQAAEDLDQYVSELNASFTVDVATKLSCLRQTIEEFNVKGFFETEGVPTYRVRLIDKARLIADRFAKNGLLEKIMWDSDDTENDFVSAFLLGCLATENQWIEMHQQAVVEGYAHIEGRAVGRPLALAARLRQGKRSRRAVVEAANNLYSKDPLLRRNDSKTANHIASMKLHSLRKRDGTYLGPDAIIKHLRGARSGTAGGKIGRNFRKPENRV